MAKLVIFSLGVLLLSAQCLIVEGKMPSKNSMIRNGTNPIPKYNGVGTPWGKPCSADNDCEFPLYCIDSYGDGLLTCKYKSCIGNTDCGTGEYCDSYDECEAKPCTNESQCPTNYICSDRAEYSDLGCIPGPCVYCTSDQKCESNVCVDKPKISLPVIIGAVSGVIALIVIGCVAFYCIKKKREGPITSKKSETFYKSKGSDEEVSETYY